MFLRCLLLNAFRCLAFWLVFAPCSPNLINLGLPLQLATTTWDLVLWLGVRFALPIPETPARFSKLLRNLALSAISVE